MPSGGKRSTGGSPRGPARAGGGGREGGSLQRGCLRKLFFSDGEPLCGSWRGSGRGGSSPRVKGGPRRAGSCRRSPLSGPVPPRRRGGRKGLPLRGGRRFPEGLVAPSFRCFPWKKVGARTSRVRAAVSELSQAWSSLNKQIKPLEVKLGREA